MRLTAKQEKDIKQATQDYEEYSRKRGRVPAADVIQYGEWLKLTEKVNNLIKDLSDDLGNLTQRELMNVAEYLEYQDVSKHTRPADELKRDIVAALLDVVEKEYYRKGNRSRHENRA